MPVAKSVIDVEAAPIAEILAFMAYLMQLNYRR
jgi:hypothetical protein